MRIGQSHREVAIVLLGAFSRYINYLQDDEIALPHTKKILKALRMSIYHYKLFKDPLSNFAPHRHESKAGY
jgi:hypothetical protein